MNRKERQYVQNAVKDFKASFLSSCDQDVSDVVGIFCSQVNLLLPKLKSLSLQPFISLISAAVSDEKRDNARFNQLTMKLALSYSAKGKLKQGAVVIEALTTMHCLCFDNALYSERISKLNRSGSKGGAETIC